MSLVYNFWSMSGYEPRKIALTSRRATNLANQIWLFGNTFCAVAHKFTWYGIHEYLSFHVWSFLYIFDYFLPRERKKCVSFQAATSKWTAADPFENRELMCFFSSVWNFESWFGSGFNWACGAGSALEIRNLDPGRQIWPTKKEHVKKFQVL